MVWYCIMIMISPSSFHDSSVVFTLQFSVVLDLKLVIFRRRVMRRKLRVGLRDRRWWGLSIHWDRATWIPGFHPHLAHLGRFWEADPRGERSETFRGKDLNLWIFVGNPMETSWNFNILRTLWMASHGFPRSLPWRARRPRIYQQLPGWAWIFWGYGLLSKVIWEGLNQFPWDFHGDFHDVIEILEDLTGIW